MKDKIMHMICTGFKIKFCMFVTVSGLNSVMELLAMYGANVNATRTDGTTALMLAAEQVYSAYSLI